jgi:hypothetical protein
MQPYIVVKVDRLSRSLLKKDYPTVKLFSSQDINYCLTVQPVLSARAGRARQELFGPA